MKDSKIAKNYFTVYIKAIIPKKLFSYLFFNLNQLIFSFHLHKQKNN